MEHIDLTLPSLRRFVHALLNDIAMCAFQHEETLGNLSSEIEGVWKFDFEHPDDANAVLLWYVLKSIEDWIPSEKFVCGWSNQLKSHENSIVHCEPDSLDIIPDYCERNPNSFFPNMSKNVDVGWREIFDTHLICMKSSEFEENTHLRILLQSDQDITPNRIIEIMPSELTDEEISILELNYLEQVFLDGVEHTKLRFTTNQLTWILSNWIRKNGRNSAYHFVHVPEHPAINLQELSELPIPPESETLREYIRTYMRPAIKKYLYSHPLEPRPPIPEKYPLGSELHPIFHIRKFDDGSPSAGIFVGMIITYTYDFPQSDLLEATDFIEYDEETKEYLDALTKPERFPFAGYASILIGEKDAIVFDRKMIAEAFSKIEKEGWGSFVDNTLENGQFILDLELSAFGVKKFKIPDRFRK